MRFRYTLQAPITWLIGGAGLEPDSVFRTYGMVPTALPCRGPLLQ